MADPILHLVTANAFRVLGLPASATQADAFGAARAMRIWSSPQEIPATPWDVSWLGSVERSRSEIEQALAKLSDPVARLEQRQTWFANQPPVCPKALLPRFGRPAPQNLQPVAPELRVAAHDLALARIAELFMTDPRLRQQADWTSALAAFRAASRSSEYVRWIVQTERNGNFDKAVTGDELKLAVRSTSAMIAEPLCERAREALERGDVNEAVTVIRTLGAIGESSAAIDSYRKGIFDRMEDVLVARCNRMTDELHRGITWGAGGGLVMRNRHLRICKHNEKEVRRSIDPFIGALKLDARNGPERTARIGLPAARMLRNLGCGWVRGGRLRHARKILARAQGFAVGTSFVQQLHGDVENVKRQQRFWPTRTKSGWKFGNTGLIVLGVVLANGLRGFLSTSTSVVPTPQYTAPKLAPTSPELLRYINQLHHQTSPVFTPPVVTPPPQPVIPNWQPQPLPPFGGRR